MVIVVNMYHIWSDKKQAIKKMKHLKRFNEAAKVEKTSKKDEIEDFIGKNKKNKSSYEMYKVLREKGYTEANLKDYFYDNY